MLANRSVWIKCLF